SRYQFAQVGVSWRHVFDAPARPRCRPHLPARPRLRATAGISVLATGGLGPHPAGVGVLRAQNPPEERGEPPPARPARRRPAPPHGVRPDPRRREGVPDLAAHRVVAPRTGRGTVGPRAQPDAVPVARRAARRAEGPHRPGGGAPGRAALRALDDPGWLDR